MRWVHFSGTCLQNTTGQRRDEGNRVGHIRLEVGGGNVFSRVQPAVGEGHLLGGVEALPVEGETRERSKVEGGQGQWGALEEWRHTVCHRGTARKGSAWLNAWLDGIQEVSSAMRPITM